MTSLGMASVQSPSIRASGPVERELQSLADESFENFLNR